VTVVLPHGDGSWGNPVFAGCHRLDGNGEMTGLSWVAECGTLTSPVGLTNTHSVGVVRDALVELEVEQRDPADIYWSLRLVAKTWDGLLNDCNGFHVRPEHVHAAIADAGDGPARSASWCRPTTGSDAGSRSTVLRWAPGSTMPGSRARNCPGSCLSPRAAAPSSSSSSPPTRRCCRTSASGSPSAPVSGSRGPAAPASTAAATCSSRSPPPNRVVASDYGSRRPPVQDVRMLSDSFIDSLFHATVEATEEAIVNAMVAAQTMTGRDDVTAHALPHDLLVKALDKHGLRSPVPDL